MRPTSSSQQRPVSRRKRLDDLKIKEPSPGQGLFVFKFVYYVWISWSLESVEELNIRVASRTANTAPKGILDTLRESVVSRGPDQKIDIKDTLKRPLTGNIYFNISSNISYLQLYVKFRIVSSN